MSGIRVPAPDLTALATALRARRRELGLSQAQVESCGGPGEATVRRLECEEGSKPHPRTQGQLERVMGWSRGTVAKILSGRAGDDPAVWVDPDGIDVHALLVADSVPDRPAPPAVRALARIELRAELLAEQVRAGTPVTADQLDAIAREAAEAGR